MRKALLSLTVAAAGILAVVVIDRASERFCHVAGAVLGAIGISLLIVSRIHLGRAFAITAHAWAARREAKVLEAAFGDAYRAYRARTWW